MKTISSAIETVCTFEKISIVDFFSDSRKREITDARCIAAAVLHYELKMHPAEIGLIFGRTRANIIHLIKNVNEIPQLNKRFIMLLTSEHLRNDIIILSFAYGTGDKTGKAELQNKVLELAKWYNIPIKQGQPKNANFNANFKEFVLNESGYLSILQKFYNSVI